MNQKKYDIEPIDKEEKKLIDSFENEKTVSLKGKEKTQMMILAKGASKNYKCMNYIFPTDLRTKSSQLISTFFRLSSLKRSSNHSTLLKHTI